MKYNDGSVQKASFYHRTNTLKSLSVKRIMAW